MKRIVVRPEQEGLRAFLFDLEADIMSIVWSRGWVEFSVADVHIALGECRKIAYTTAMTTVHRLYEKGILDRRRDGRRYVYWPVMDLSSFEQTVMTRLAEALKCEG